MENTKDNEVITIPYIAFESAKARYERIIQRLILAIVILSVSFAAVVAVNILTSL